MDELAGSNALKTGSLTASPKSLSIAVTTVLILWVVVFHATMLPLGDISHYDEFITLDRSASFERQGDWLNVYSENEVTFNKPPLQYWFGGLLLKSGETIAVALRAPALVFAFGCLLATALLAAAMRFDNPWITPASVLLLTSSERFWESSLSALLDTGSLFFATLALAATIAALRRPLFWYLVAAAIGLGAWQKAPIALAFVLLYLVFLGLTGRWHAFGFRSFATNKHFQISAVLAVFFSASWHVWQVIQHGMIALESGIGDQMVNRFAPSLDQETTRSVKDVISHMIGGEGALRFFGLLAVFALPFRLKRYDLLPIPLIFLTYMIVISFAGGFVSHRYTLLFTTMIAVALSAVILSFNASNSVKVAVLAAISLLSGGPVTPPSELRLFQGDTRRTQLAALSEFAASDEQSDTLFFCNWDNKTRIPPGAIAFFGSNGRPFIPARNRKNFGDRVQGRKLAGTVSGICAIDQIEYLAPYVEEMEIVAQTAEYVHFRAQIRPPDAEAK